MKKQKDKIDLRIYSKIDNQEKRIRRLEKGNINVAEAIFKDIEDMLENISVRRSAISPLITIGRQNCMNDIDNELEELKKKYGMK